MSRQSDAEIRPRNGHTLIVGIVARISGCANQKELSLDDQIDNAKETIGELCQCPVEYQLIATVGKGERLDRPELEQIEEAYSSKTYDFFVYDDLSRLIRGGEAARLLGVGVDHGTRSICIEDGIDTIEGTWEEDALNACSENVAHNERTSKRIKQKKMNRFKKLGKTDRRPIAGYIVPEGAKYYDEWMKDDNATPTILEGAALLKETLDYSLVADFFKERNFSVGPYVRSGEWQGSLVRNFFTNPLLKGMPSRGMRHSVKHHGTGRRISLKNPNGPTYYSAPHLAHLPPVEFDELNALMGAKNANRGRPPYREGSPVGRVTPANSRFPGCHSRCWYCGHHHVWGGNGTVENLMCNNVRAWHCWNGVSFNGELAIQKLIAEICNQLPRLDGFDDQFAAMVELAAMVTPGKLAEEINQLKAEEQSIAKQKQRVVDAIKEYGSKDFIRAAIEVLEAREQQLLLRRHEISLHRQNGLKLPESFSVLGDTVREQFERLSVESLEFARLLRLLVPDIYVYAVRFYDGGPLFPRAKVKLNLGGTFPDLSLVDGLEDRLTHEVTLDLFTPPKRELIRLDAVRLDAEGMAPCTIGQTLAERSTAKVVRAALALHKHMTELGLVTPYATVLDPPDDCPRYGRHKHKRYVFRPLEGYERPAL